MKFTQNYGNKFTVITKLNNTFRLSLNSKGKIKVCNFNNNVVSMEKYPFSRTEAIEIKEKIKEIENNNLFKNLKQRFDMKHKAVILEQKAKIKPIY